MNEWMYLIILKHYNFQEKCIKYNIIFKNKLQENKYIAHGYCTIVIMIYRDGIKNFILSMVFWISEYFIYFIQRKYKDNYIHNI